MGGYGSGRKPEHYGTTGDLYRLDVRYFARRGMLRPGVLSSWTWTRGGEVTASASGMCSPDRARFTLYYSLTACHYGGARPWFLCPSCGRRVACLYFSLRWACRRCADLVYPVQREEESGRLRRAAWKMRDRLGQVGGTLFDPYPTKPR